MKTLCIILLLFISTLADELQWVDTQIQAIKPPRVALSKAKINTVKNPFIFLKKKEVSGKKSSTVSSKVALPKQLANTSKVSTNTIARKSTSYTLQAIINTSALINGKWYTLQDKIGRYTLSSINTKTATLTYKKKKLYLSTRSSIKKLKFKNN